MSSLTKHLTNNVVKNKEYILCEYCNYKCSKKCDFNKHIQTSKHKKAILLTNQSISLTEKEENTIQQEFICKNCNKLYNSRVGLWYHNKKCTKTIYNDADNIDIQSQNTDIHIQVDNDNTIISYHELHNIVLDIVKSNQELQKQNMELQKQMMDVCKNIQPLVSNTINQTNQTNQTNSHNKTFNLQFFLNETCKDAMNISEFIDYISLQLSDLESVGKLGFVEGISNIIIKSLKALDVEKRPVHCSDIKREIMYVKDEDTWEKENEEKQKIKKVISSIVSKNLGLLPEFQKKYPECMKPDSKKSDEYNLIIMETMGGVPGSGEKNKEKIIRKIAKEVTIDKE
jgi:hypothetical protein